VTTQPAMAAPSAAPKKRHAWLVVLLITFAVSFVAFVGVVVAEAGEDICFDRSPWWGPPQNPNSTCAGHWYEAHH
jgi:hypothetical protein